MAENLRKEIEKELKSLQSKVATFSNAVDIVSAAEKLADKSGELLDDLYLKHSDYFKESTQKLKSLVEEQETLFKSLNSASDGLTKVATKIEKDDLSGKVNSIKKSLDEQQKEIGELEKKLTEQTEFIVKQFQQIVIHSEQQYQNQVNKQSSGFKDILSNQSSSFQDIVFRLSELSRNTSNEFSELKKVVQNANKNSTELVNTKVNELKNEINSNKKMNLALFLIVIAMQIGLFAAVYLGLI